MKWLVLLLLALSSFAVYAKDPFACMYSGNVPSKGIFTFEVWRASDFDKGTSFRLCDLAGKTFLLVKAKVGKNLKVRTIDLNVEQRAKLNGLYEKALGSNFKDDAFGTDGSSWCLEANRMNYLRACFWSPKVETERRGIVDFVALGTELWELAQFHGSDGQLN